MQLIQVSSQGRQLTNIYHLAENTSEAVRQKQILSSVFTLKGIIGSHANKLCQVFSEDAKIKSVYVLMKPIFVIMRISILL